MAKKGEGAVVSQLVPKLKESVPPPPPPWPGAGGQLMGFAGRITLFCGLLSAQTGTGGRPRDMEGKGGAKRQGLVGVRDIPAG